MNVTTIAPAVGSDNISPMYDPNGRWQVWNKDEIFLGGVGSAKYVPKVGDMVIELNGLTSTTYKVHSLNQTTYVPNLQLVNDSRQTNNLSNEDLLFGVGPGTQSDTYRVYVDKSVTPHRLSVDRRLKVLGSTCTLCKIFKGADTSSSGIVISGKYNSDGTLNTENIPLEVVASERLNNTAIKVVSNAFTTADLMDGELVTAVLYDSGGFVVSKRQLIVENTGFVRGTDEEKKYVTSIALDSPFLSSTNNRLIQYPINVPLNAMNLNGIVNYSDGSSTRLSVDGTRFKVLGLEDYSATIIGQSSDLVLKYKLGQNEEALGVTTGTDKFITEQYTVTTTSTNGNYQVQLYAIPVWISPTVGYNLRWFMYDLDRSINYEVTPNVNINTEVSAYNPKSYGSVQNLRVSVNLRSVNASYNNFNHVQLVKIVLNKAGTERPGSNNVPNWTTNSVANNNNSFGTNTYSTYRNINSTTWKIKIAPRLSTQTTWLEAMYKNTYPLFDPRAESQPPQPTHFIVVNGDNSFEFTIDKWDEELSINRAVADNSTLFIKFIMRTPQRDLELSICGSQAFQVNAAGAFI